MSGWCCEEGRKIGKKISFLQLSRRPPTKAKQTITSKDLCIHVNAQQQITTFTIYNIA